jgi:hypothetical protein
MLNQRLKLIYIEDGRLSINEMNELYGGTIVCGSYTPCVKKKGSCIQYFDCDNPYDPTQSRNHCGNYTWVSEHNEFELLDDLGLEK